MEKRKVKIIYVYYEYILNKKHMNNELEIYFPLFGYQLFSSALWVKINIYNLYFSDQACFPSRAKVNLKTGKVVTLSELKIGNQIQTGSNIAEENFILTCLNSKIQKNELFTHITKKLVDYLSFFVIVIFWGV